MEAEPNLLKSVMDERGVRQADLLRALEARGVETTKQTVFKLYHGQITVDPEWAQHFSAIFNLPWTDFIKPTSLSAISGTIPKAITPETTAVLEGEGDFVKEPDIRLWVRILRAMDIDDRELLAEIVNRWILPSRKIR